MLKYVYKNATVYITSPTERHVKNIRQATEIFMRKVIKEKKRNEHFDSSRGIKKKSLLDK